MDKWRNINTFIILLFNVKNAIAKVLEHTGVFIMLYDSPLFIATIKPYVLYKSNLVLVTYTYVYLVRGGSRGLRASLKRQSDFKYHIY